MYILYLNIENVHNSIINCNLYLNSVIVNSLWCSLLSQSLYIQTNTHTAYIHSTLLLNHLKGVSNTMTLHSLALQHVFLKNKDIVLLDYNTYSV